MLFSPLVFWLMNCLMLHPVHQTISEVQWDAKTSRVEVALRLDVLDEQWIDNAISKEDAEASAERSESQRLKSQNLDSLRLEYLRRRFRVSPLPKKGKSDAAKYRWVGRQSDGGHVWWYFEITPPAGKRPDSIESKVLLDRSGNYQHRIVFLNEVPKKSVDVSREKSKVPFPAEAEIPVK